MKKVNILLFGFLFGFLFITTSCSKDDDEVITPVETKSEAQILVEYLEANGDYANTYLPAIISAADIKAAMATNTVFIIDIRGATAYDTAHIDYEHIANIPVANLLTYTSENDLSSYEKIAVVCYTGQTAGYATTLLRLSGLDNAFAMLYGMSSWHADFAGSWNTNTGSLYSIQFEKDAVEKGPMGDLPTLSTGKTEAIDILDAQINSVLAGEFSGAAITNTMVMDNPENYYVVNYWAAEDYNKYGHVPGAIQYTPKESMSLETDLTTLPTDKTIVVYCWTGQGSAALTTYLKVLGYDAKSLKFGANGMIYNDLEAAHQWSEASIAGYDYWHQLK
ncbi:MAG: rhodanese-like domain-containing protein [Salinivirgaceae bacterium]|nr:rhodanese-like domain-containing protein [Salinivirgaceae bacterium]